MARRGLGAGLRLPRLLVGLISAITLVTGIVGVVWSAPTAHSSANTKVQSSSVSTATGPIRLTYPTSGPADPTQNFGNLYLPAPARATIPLVVLVHGGGWRYRDGGLGGLTAMARDLSRHGIAVFNTEYRRIGSGGGWPTTLTDVRDAAEFAAGLPARYPSINGPIVLVGHSAGGQLALWAATHEPHPPQAVVSIAGPLDMRYAEAQGDPNVRAFLGIPSQVPARYAVADPSSQAPPAIPLLLLQGTRDRVVPLKVVQRYLEDMAGRTLPAMRLDELPGATHTSLVTRGGIGYADTLAAIEQFVPSVGS